jgi:site-specific DNA-adenine methylase
MWSYYGSKSKVVKYYSKPLFDTIIEPFAGTARYSLFEDNWKLNVILRDVNPKVIRLWKWLQNVATKELILCLPQLDSGDVVPDYLPVEARWLVGFNSNQGSENPRNYAGNFNNWESRKLVIAEILYKIKHWDIQFGDYRSLPNIEATWFIDPPYINGGERYKYFNYLDYKRLGFWCKSRLGQVIVCENEGAKWLPFSKLVDMQGSVHKRTELVYEHLKRRSFDNVDIDSMPNKVLEKYLSKK